MSHEKLKNQLDFGLNGEFILPVKNGRKIKGFYIKTILKALKTINEVD